MANQIIPLVWEKPLRKSAVNTLDKVNELVDFINDSDIHEFSFIERGTGESVQTGTSTQLADLAVYGKSVQDGTPTPENPVPVQVVGGKNLSQTANINSNNALINSQLLQPGNYVLSFDSSATEGGFNIRANSQTGETIKQYTFASQTETRRHITLTINEAMKLFINGFGISFGSYPMINIQIEAGTQATPYVPYGCIGLRIGETVTPIDLQGHTLAGLPDGTRDVLRVDSAGNVWIDKNTLKITLDGSQNWRRYAGFDSTGQYGYYFAVSPQLHYDANSADILCDALKGVSQNTIMSAGNACSVTTAGNEISARMQFATVEEVNAYFTSNPAKVYAKLATPQTIELGYITPPAIPSGSVVSIDATLTPTIYLAWWTEGALPQVIDSLKGYVDSKIAEVNTRIDTLHGVTPAYTQIINSPDKLTDIAIKDEIIEPDKLTETTLEEKEI